MTTRRLGPHDVAKTIGELIKELQQFDPNLQVVFEKSDSPALCTDDILLPDDIHQVSADFVKVTIGWYGRCACPSCRQPAPS
jgi:hypothetical protein